MISVFQAPSDDVCFSSYILSVAFSDLDLDYAAPLPMPNVVSREHLDTVRYVSVCQSSYEKLNLKTKLKKLNK